MEKKAIILIDDEKTVLDSLMTQMREWFAGRFIFEAVQSVEEAWEVIAEFQEDGPPIRLIISDWMMGPDRGDEFLTEVHKRYPEIDLVMLSGYADEDSIQRAREYANLQAFIRKPWDEDELHNELEKILS